jgi:hypothetical protein
MGRIEGCSRENFPEGLGVFPESREKPVVFPKIPESPGVTRNLAQQGNFVMFGPESEQENFGRFGSKAIRNAVDLRAKRAKDFELFGQKRCNIRSSPTVASSHRGILSTPPNPNPSEPSE